MIRFIYGDHGSGKTKKILNMINEDTQNGIHTFLLVPDQEALQFERLTLSALPASSQLELEVLGFSRLYNRVCREYGNISYSYITKPIRYLLMWKTLRELRGVLETLGVNNKKEVAIEDLLISSINELKINGISADMLEDAASDLQKSSPELASKAYDLAAIYTCFNSYVSEKYSDSADDLSRLRDVLDEHDFFKGKSVYIDSFSSFTPVQHRIIEKIFKSAKDVTVTIPVSKRNLSSIDAKSIYASEKRLLRAANEVSSPVTEELTLRKGTKSEAIEHLSKNIWCLNGKNLYDSPCPDQSVILEECDTPYSEAEAVSAHIRKLLSEGARCRDIVIISRDAESYRGIIDQSLQKSSIPFYFSDNLELCSTAAVKFIISALRIKLYHWQKNDVISHIKTGLCDIDTVDANLFEEYVNTWDIKGEQFKEPYWNMNPDGFSSRPSERGEEILAAANRVRSAIVPSLEKLFILLDASNTVDDMCKAIYSYLVDARLEEKLTHIAQRAAKLENLKVAQETSRIYEIILSSLADVGTALEGEKSSTEEFISILKSVFDKTDVNTIPTSIDEVTIGSANMLRTSNPKYAFVLGLCEGKFPAAIKDNGIFSSADKKVLSDSGIELDSDTDSRASDELMYVKRSFSAPSERLYLLTHRSEINGDKCFKSLAFLRAEALLNLKAHQYSESDFSYLIPAPKNAAMNLRSIKDARKNATLKKALEPYVEGIEKYSSQSIKTTSCFTSASMLDKNSCKDKSANAINFSASSFEAYAKCPFNYFCRYTLALRDKKNANFGSDNVGMFIHAVLENVIKQVVPSSPNQNPLSDNELIKLTEKTVKDYLNLVCPTHLLVSKRLSHLYSRLQKLSLLLARNIIKEFSDSDFYPAFFELKLNGKYSNPAPLTFTLENGTKISFSGIVDRVDLYRNDSSVFVRIVDYKTGTKEFDLDDLKYGINTQMLLYLYTICRNGSLQFRETIGADGDTEIYPAGIVYLSSSVTSINNDDYQDVSLTEEQIEKKLLRSGLLLGDEDILTSMNHSLDPAFLAGIKKNAKGEITGKALASYDKFNEIYNELETVIIKISTELDNGVISARPLKSKYSPCEYCTSKPICRNVQK